MALRVPTSYIGFVRSQVLNNDGTPSFATQKLFQDWNTRLEQGLSQQGQLIGPISTVTLINGRGGSIGTILGNISDAGLVLGPGVDFAEPYLNKDTDHIADGTGHPLAGGKVAYSALVAATATAGQGLVYSGALWLPHNIAQSLAKVAKKWLDSYDAATGLLTQSQPDYSDLSGLPTLPATIAPVAGEFLTGYDASTGAFSQAVPTGLSVTIVTAALTALGTQGSMTFTNGLLTSQTPAT